MRQNLSKLVPILPVLLVLGLLIFPQDISEAAASAALLWWSSVLPALLPYLIAASLLSRSEALLRVPNRLLPSALFLSGALLGYPVGAKLAGSLFAQGALCKDDAERVAVRCNLPNPVFLLSVVALRVFGDLRCTIPLLIGVYAVALLFALPLYRISAQRTRSARVLLPNDLPEAIGDGVRTIAVIGGCIVFASVLGALLNAIALPDALHRLFGVSQAVVNAAALGLFEMTCGVRAAASLPFSLPVRLALAAGFVQFGGLSVMLQTASQFPVRMLRYAAHKLPAAVLSGFLTFLLTPLFLPDTLAPTFASAAQMQQNAYSLLSITVSAVIGLLTVFVFTARFSPEKKKLARVPKNTGTVED